MTESEFNSHFKKQFIDMILADLFADYRTHLEKEELDIFQKNNIANGYLTSANSCFIFKGKYYYYPDIAKDDEFLIKASLDSSLEFHMQDFIDDTLETDNEYRAIAAYLRRLLSLANTFEDIFLLWPKILSEYLDRDMQNARTTSTMVRSLRNVTIEQFHKDTQSSLVYIKERKFKNLLIN